jgi:hypothetical protein
MELYDDLREGLDVADLEEDGSEARKAASINRGGDSRMAESAPQCGEGDAPRLVRGQVSFKPGHRPQVVHDESDDQQQ